MAHALRHVSVLAFALAAACGGEASGEATETDDSTTSGDDDSAEEVSGGNGDGTAGDGDGTTGDGDGTTGDGDGSSGDGDGSSGDGDGSSGDGDGSSGDGDGTSGDGDGDGTSGDGDGDGSAGDGDGTPGDGDGDGTSAAGDGDGPTGDGDGSTGDGDGSTGDGDGSTGDGDGSTGDGDGSTGDGDGSTGDGDGSTGDGDGSTGDGDGSTGDGDGSTGDGDGSTGDGDGSTGDGDGSTGDGDGSTGDGDGSTGDGDGDGGHGDGDGTPLYTVVSTVFVSSDGPGGDDAYDRFRPQLGQNSVESPDLYPTNHPGVPHVTESSGSPVGDYFTFWMHRDLDHDRDNGPTDRQRNEAKAYNSSVEEAKARENESFRYHWYFRIPNGFPVSPSFSHFMQIKAVDGDDQQPVLTLTGRVRSGMDVVELRHNASSAVPFDILVDGPWSSMLGQWLEAELIVTNSDSGYVFFCVRPQSGGAPILLVETTGVDLWRDSASFNRPKWGIYRSTANIAYLVNDTDSVDLADFTIQEITLP